ncbi:MAG TPA: NAD-dependent epimerase/dehydratase family protein, partial [Candidatus Hydrogenedentes bacterium]|nr:NAD-dependent epimerase/dehydratase family protein [Candidatus Hydrogenedentota bacterium]
MAVILVTGSAGLIGSESVRYFSGQGRTVIGLDNDMRAYFFGDGASTGKMARDLQEQFPRYIHHNTDIRDYTALSAIFSEYQSEIHAVIHTAAQPSHDWAAREPLTDFGVNAQGTQHLLELTRQYCPDAVFIFT